MTDTNSAGPDSTAVRVALWRALHVQVDPPPHVLEDEIGLRLVAPPEDWRERRDMHPQFTSRFRASIVARARFIEDLAMDQAGRGVSQYVILGAGLDTFAQRHPEIGSKLCVFEIDQPGTQAWKRQRLMDLGYGIPEWLRLVPVDFEKGGSWMEQLEKNGFDRRKPAVISSTGVTMYLTKDAISAKLRQVASLAPGSTFAMTFMLPMEHLEPDERRGLEEAAKGARASGTPFLSFFTPEDMSALARKAGFREVRHISGTDLRRMYFPVEEGGARPSSAEELLIATT